MGHPARCDRRNVGRHDDRRARRPERQHRRQAARWDARAGLRFRRAWRRGKPARTHPHRSADPGRTPAARRLGLRHGECRQDRSTRQVLVHDHVPDDRATASYRVSSPDVVTPTRSVVTGTTTRLTQDPDPTKEPYERDRQLRCCDLGDGRFVAFVSAREHLHLGPQHRRSVARSAAAATWQRTPRSPRTAVTSPTSSTRAATPAGRGRRWCGTA